MLINLSRFTREKKNQEIQKKTLKKKSDYKITTNSKHIHSKHKKKIIPNQNSKIG